MSISVQHACFSGKRAKSYQPKLRLERGSRGGIIGDGPAGSFFGCFLADLTERLGFDRQVDIYEQEDFSGAGPGGCIMCAGIASGTHIQNPTIDEIRLPLGVNQLSIAPYVPDSDAGQIPVKNPDLVKRTGATFPGHGSRKVSKSERLRFDGNMLSHAIFPGATDIQKKVDRLELGNQWKGHCVRGTVIQEYDLSAIAIGASTSASGLLEMLEGENRPPRQVQRFIREHYQGEETSLGSCLQLAVPRRARNLNAEVPGTDQELAARAGKRNDN